MDSSVNTIHADPDRAARVESVAKKSSEPVIGTVGFGLLLATIYILHPEAPTSIPVLLIGAVCFTVTAMFLRRRRQRPYLDALSDGVAQCEAVDPRLVGPFLVLVERRIIVHQPWSLRKVTELYVAVADQFGTDAAVELAETGVELGVLDWMDRAAELTGIDPGRPED